MAEATDRIKNEMAQVGIAVVALAVVIGGVHVMAKLTSIYMVDDVLPESLSIYFSSIFSGYAGVLVGSLVTWALLKLK